MKNRKTGLMDPVRAGRVGCECSLGCDPKSVWTAF